MVILANGRFELPDNLYYSKDHVYIDMENSIIGLDQIGFSSLEDPTEILLIGETEVKIGEPFVKILTGGKDSKEIFLLSPCNAKIEDFNKNALEFMENDTYTQGYILKLKEISEIHSELLTGSEIENWAKTEVSCILQETYSFKILIIGDMGSGKSSVRLRFTDNIFLKYSEPTQGLDIGSKELNCSFNDFFCSDEGEIHEFKVKLNIWDISGNSEYEMARGMYYLDIKGVVICIDTSKPDCCSNLEYWIEDLEDNIGLNFPIVVLGTKNDLDQKYDKAALNKLIEEYDLKYQECFAKSNQGIDECINELTIEVFKKERSKGTL